MKNTGIKIAEIKRELKARFYAAGAIVAEIWTKPIKTDNPTKIEWPKDAYAFEIVEEVTVVTDDGVECRGTRLIDGKKYYHPDSQVMRLKDIPDRPKYHFLRFTMENAGWDAIVFPRCGDFPLPFDPERDVILPKEEHNEKSED